MLFYFISLKIQVVLSIALLIAFRVSYVDGPPLDYTSVPPPSNPGYNITPTTDSTGYNTGVPHNTGVPPNYTGVGYQQYSLTYHPQYAGIKEKHMIMTQVKCALCCMLCCVCVCVCVIVCVCVCVIVHVCV